MNTILVALQSMRAGVIIDFPLKERVMETTK
jgi:hypothetical protein